TNFALFEYAEIRAFSVDRRIPFHLTSINMRWMIALLKGCHIDDVSLVLERDTRPQIKFIPELLSLVNARRVEFFLQTAASCDMFMHFEYDNFSEAIC
ncbi:hypothetical protein PFISCL1PPCAC_26439, partial [Pristionchus fissidentatus]